MPRRARRALVPADESHTGCEVSAPRCFVCAKRGRTVAHRDDQDRRDVGEMGQKPDRFDRGSEVEGRIAKVEDMRGGFCGLAVPYQDPEVVADVVRVQIVNLSVG